MNEDVCFELLQVCTVNATGWKKIILKFDHIDYNSVLVYTATTFKF